MDSRSFSRVNFRFVLAMVFSALLAMVVLTPASAQTFPKLTGRVVDNANLLDPAQEQALTLKLEGLEAQSGRQLVVATLPDLQGYEIEEYGYQLGREWGIGDAERNDGALLIVAPNERKVRIEVGYGLEGIMTDALSSVIIQQEILPRFREDNYPGGIEAGVDAITMQLALPEDEARAYADQVGEQAQSEGDGGFPFAFMVIVMLLFYGLPALLRAKGGKRYRDGGSGPIILWGPSSSSSWGSSSGGGSSWGGGGGGFSGGGGSFGGGGASGGW